jgi:hypothetical protein
VMSFDALLRQMAETSDLEKRIMTTTNPPDGMPKESYRAYHIERARPHRVGSPSTSRDSPPALNNGSPIRTRWFPGCLASDAGTSVAQQL